MISFLRRKLNIGLLWHNAAACNIDRHERFWRALIGIAVLGDVAIWWCSLNLVIGMSVFLNALFIVPTFLGFIGIFEATAGFCIMKQKIKEFSDIQPLPSRPISDMRENPAAPTSSTKLQSRIIIVESIVSALLLISFLIALTAFFINTSFIIGLCR